MNLKIFSFLFLLAICGMTSCQKESISESNSKRFIKTFGTDAKLQRNGNYGLTDIIETQDGGFVTAGVAHHWVPDSAWEDWFLEVYKVDKNGNVIWHRPIPLFLDPDYVHVIRVALTEFPNGNLLITSRSNDVVFSLGSDGELLGSQRFMGPDFNTPPSFLYEYFSPPVWGDDGKLYLSASTNKRRHHHLWTIDDMGQTSKVDFWLEDAFWFSNVIKVKGGNYWYSGGYVFPNSNSSVIAGAKRFWQPAHSVVGLSSAQERRSYREDPIGSAGAPIATEDRIVVIGEPLALTQGQYYPDNIGFRLAIYDLEYNTIFKGYIDDPKYSMDPSAVVEVDGGFVICGSAVSGSGTRRTFILKVDQNGQVLHKNFDFQDGYVFRNISQASDGDLIVCGYADGLGIGQTQVNKPLLIAKLGPNGELE